MKKIYPLLLLATLTGCGLNPSIDVSSTPFYVSDFKVSGSIIVLSPSQEINSSIEFQTYKVKLESHLQKVGYKIAESMGSADHIAFISYGIDNGKNNLGSTPIIGQTGTGSSYTTGSVYGNTFSSSTYSMPTYGVVGSSNYTYTTYTRNIAIDIIDAKTSSNEKPRKEIELRAKSTGSCSVINEVFDEMLEGLFKDFPGENGKTRRISVDGDFNC
jgi:hypothetical protein